jgi:hypothetical protein
MGKTKGFIYIDPKDSKRVGGGMGGWVGLGNGWMGGFKEWVDGWAEE